MKRTTDFVCIHRLPPRTSPEVSNIDPNPPAAPVGEDVSAVQQVRELCPPVDETAWFVVEECMRELD